MKETPGLATLADGKFLPRLECILKKADPRAPRTVLNPDNMWLPPYFQYYITATLAGEQPSERQRFPDNGVVLLGNFSFSSTPEAEEEEEPSMSISEPYNRNHRG